MKREIIIWGTGVIGRSIYYRILRENLPYEVKYFVDNYSLQSFYDLDVFRPDRENCSKFLVVVASTVYYEDIASQLIEFGLEELKDFIPYEALDKEVILMHGNCHTDVIREYLNTSYEFKKKYWIYPLPPIAQNKKKYIKEHLLKNCDVFIYQDVQENNPFDKRLSASYLISKVCGKKICIPNLFGMGKILYPQGILCPDHGVIKNPTGKEMPGGLFNHRDENIDRLWLAGERDVVKISKYLEGEVYSKEFIRKNVEECFEKIERREDKWDIKILSFIKEKLSETQLFIDPAFPCNIIFRKISEDILELLKIDKNTMEEIAKDHGFGISEMPIYKCVREALDLQYTKKYIRDIEPVKYAKLIDKDMDLLEYCREYCFWCFDWKEGLEEIEA